MYVDHELPVGAHPYPIDYLTAPFLSADVDEAELHACDSPLLQRVEDCGSVLLEGLAVYVEDHTKPLLLRRGYHLEDVELLALCKLLRRKAGLKRVHRALVAVPAAVELDVGKAVARRKLGAFESARRRELGDAQHLAGPDPARVRDARRRIERTKSLVLSLRERRTVGSRADVSPRSLVGKRHGRRPFQDRPDDASFRSRQKANARIVLDACIADDGGEVLSFDHKRRLRRSLDEMLVAAPLARAVAPVLVRHGRDLGDRRNGLRHVFALRVAHRPAAQVVAEVECPRLLGHGALALAFVSDAPCDSTDYVRRLERCARAELRK